MKELLGGGGPGGIAHKACMAALGYDWELDFNTIMDTAYTQSFETNVMSPVTRRSFLFINPTTGKPVFEYRGGVYITPGCTIDSYTVSLVCVTAAEKAKYGKSINCQNDACGCIKVAKGGEQSFFMNTKVQGGRLSQGVPEDRAFHEVADQSTYVYDHIKVELFMNADQKKNCLPKGHEDGIFYFPIADRTPVTTYGCQIIPSTGTIMCTSGLAKELGFGNLVINNVEMSTNAYVGQTLIAYPVITKTGSSKMCMMYKVYKGDPDTGQMKYGPRIIEILDTETYTNQRYVAGLRLFDGTVPGDMLGGTAQGSITSITSGTDVTKEFHPAIEPFQTSKSGSMTITLVDGGNGEFKCSDGNDKYSINGGPQDQVLSQASNCKISDGAREVKLTSLIPAQPENFKGKTITLTYTVTGVSSDVTKESKMTLQIIPIVPTKEGSCAEGTPVSGGEYKFPFTIYRENPEGGPGGSCPEDSLNPVVKDCACGGVNNVNCFAKKEGSPTQGYCYKEQGQTKASCQPQQDLQAQGQITQQFGGLEVWEGTTNKLTPSQVPGGQAIRLDSSKTYNVYLTNKPAGFEWKVIYVVGLSLETDMVLKGDVYQATLNAGEYTKGEALTLTINIKDAKDEVIVSKTEKIWIEAGTASPGAGLKEPCGPATSGTNNGQSGKCLNECSGIDKRITNEEISTAEKRCLGDLKCCIT